MSLFFMNKGICHIDKRLIYVGWIKFMVKIGLIPLYDDEKNSFWMLPGYMEVVERCGALPIMLPLTTDEDELNMCFQICDGFLFTGGHDVNPATYKIERSEKCGISCDKRDYMETFLLKKAIQEDKPVLGICRGIQIMNVVLGGSLYQDLETEYAKGTNHQMLPPYDRVVHKVTIYEDTQLANIIGAGEYGVNSYHHQAIKELAECVQPMAISEDGLIEAIGMTNNKFIIGVQWHPELAFQKDEKSMELVQAFVDSCR